MRRATIVLLTATTALALAGCGRGDDDAAASGASGSYTPGPVVASAVDDVPTEEERQQTAYDVCVDAATEQLKAPATAKFAPIEDVKMDQAAGQYVVQGDVDSENSFGALIRSTYTCGVIITAAGEQAGTASVTFTRN